MNLEKMTYKAARYLSRNSSTILTTLGAVGVVATTIVAVNATPKVHTLIKQTEYENKEPLTTFEKIRIAAPHYIPSALVGLGTISCIIGSNLVNQKYQQSLLGAYALLDSSYKSYRKSARNIFGPDADNQIMMDVAHKAYIASDGYAVYNPDNDESDVVLFFDYYSNRYFKATLAAVINAQYHINRNLLLKGEVSVNEFYEFLGLEKLQFGDHLGWGDDFWEGGMSWLDFENKLTTLEDGIECYIISALYEPEILYASEMDK
jgi:hypothetical protein